MAQLFELLLGPAVSAYVGATPPWLSDVSDDHTPYEFSVVLGGPRPELRLLVERRDDFSLGSNAIAGGALTHTLLERFDLGRHRFDALEPLFLNGDESPGALFSIWHAVSFWPGERPELKLYFNLSVHGPERAVATAHQALERLGLGHHWPHVAAHAMRRGPARDLPMYLSIDLDDGAGARTKLYFRHLGATTDALERVFVGVRDHRAGKITALCEALTGERGPFLRKAPVSCLIFLDEERARPAGGTFYFPIAAYLLDDRVARDRVARYLTTEGLSPLPYTRALDEYAQRPLERGIGMQSYVSTRPTTSPPRATIYFSPEETFTVRAPAMNLDATVAAAPAPTPDELVAYHETRDITLHPYFVKMGQEPVDLPGLWRLMSNFNEGIVQHFPRRLAQLTARVTDDRVRSILAKQLNDELGDGHFERAHRGLFGRLLTALAPFRPSELAGDALAAGRTLGEALEHAYVTAPLSFAIGASIVVEIYGKQVDTRVGAEFRRQTQLDDRALEWLHLHENLEVEHADESLDLARLLPDDEQARVDAAAGARSIADAAWKFFDALYAQSFS